MRLEQLQFFLEVSKSNSVSLAASRLFMTQQNVSTAIRKLEEELGFDLFERMHQGVRLTARGKEVLVVAEEIVQKVNDLKMIGHAIEEKLTGELHVDMVPYIALPEMIVDFYRFNPSANIKTTEKSPRDIIASVQTGATDVGFVYLRAGEELDAKDIKQEALTNDQLYFCAGKKLNLPCHSYTTAALFEKQLPFVVFNGLYDWTMETLEEMGGQNPLVYRADIQLYKKMILEGLAVGFATQTGIEQEIVFNQNEVDVMKIKDVHLTVCMLYKQEPSSTLKEVFIDTAREKFKQMG